MIKDGKLRGNRKCESQRKEEKEKVEERLGRKEIKTNHKETEDGRERNE